MNKKPWIELLGLLLVKTPTKSIIRQLLRLDYKSSRAQLFLIFYLISFNLFSQLSINQVIEIAKKNNGNLKTTQLEISGQRALLPAAYDIPRAGLDLQLGQTQAKPLDYTVGIVQPFASRSVYRAQEKLLQSQVGLIEKRLGLEQNELTFRVKEQYYQLLYQYKLKNLLSQQDSLFQTAANAAKIHYQTGETNKLEAMALETRLREIQNRIVASQGDLNIGYRNLQALLFTNDVLQIDTSIVLKRNVIISKSNDYEKTNPFVEILKQQNEVNSNLTETEKQRQKPDWRLGVSNQSIMREYGFVYVQGGIGIPIFNKAQKARVEAAKINEQVSENQLQTTIKQLQANLDILEQERQKYEKALDYYEKSALPQANLLVSTALKTFRAGEIDYVAFFQNVQQVAQIRENYIANQLNYSLIVIQIEKIVGQ
jgi:heavy metal efflux system protein